MIQGVSLLITFLLVEASSFQHKAPLRHEIQYFGTLLEASERQDGSNAEAVPIQKATMATSFGSA